MICHSAGKACSYARLVGFYGDRILPRLIDRTCGIQQLDPLRARTCAPLHGDVVEIGFGSGLNIAHYPSAVAAVTAVEPSDTAWNLAAERTAATTVPIERAGLDGEQLPFPDNSFDCALSTFTMCTIPNLEQALSELVRVLRPGGTLCFLEHGRAPDDDVRRWQRRLEPIQRRVAGGCHLTRDIVASIEAAGLTPGAVDAFYESGAPRPFGAITLGSARTSM